MNENVLVTCPLFRGISKKEHDAFLERNRTEIIRFKKGETVVRQGDVINAMHLLVKGVVQTQMASSISLN
jgi:Cyclic nucleotide-binding domain.